MNNYMVTLYDETGMEFDYFFIDADSMKEAEKIAEGRCPPHYTYEVVEN